MCLINAEPIYQSRIIDGEFFPHTLSAADTIILKLLREIIDIKYLQTPQFTGQVLPSESVFYFYFILIKRHFCRLSSQIQDWSTAYRLAIARTQDGASCCSK